MSNNHWRKRSKNHASQSDFIAIHQYEAQSEKLFRLHIPKHFKKKINFNNHNDPLLLQVMPSKYELIKSADELDDPVGDLNASSVKGVIHKYYGRVLLIAAATCAINCRYCFRRNFPYSNNYASQNNWVNAITYIKENPEIHEVILSGGDPLMLSTKTLEKLTIQLESIPHIKTLRIHTRTPLVTPSRITSDFLKWLNNIKLKKVMVLHCNHPKELDKTHKPIFLAIKGTGTLLLNQSVLLNKVNNNAKSLIRLSHKLFDYGILPYYLNQLDKATGTAHFQIQNDEAIAIHKQLLEKLPGYLVPKLVVDISEKNNKTLLF